MGSKLKPKKLEKSDCIYLTILNIDMCKDLKLKLDKETSVKWLDEGFFTEFKIPEDIVVLFLNGRYKSKLTYLSNTQWDYFYGEKYQNEVFLSPGEFVEKAKELYPKNVTI